MTVAFSVVWVTFINIKESTVTTICAWIIYILRNVFTMIIVYWGVFTIFYVSSDQQSWWILFLGGGPSGSGVPAHRLCMSYLLALVAFRAGNVVVAQPVIVFRSWFTVRCAFAASITSSGVSIWDARSWCWSISAAGTASVTGISVICPWRLVPCLDVIGCIVVRVVVVSFSGSASALDLFC